MPVVELATDARFRPDGDGFAEVCTGCGADRGPRETCACGLAFTRLKRGFLVTAWEPAQIAVKLPARCPHCGAKPTRSIAIWDQRFTRAKGLGGAEETYLKIEVPVCARVRQPIWLYLAQIATTVLAVMAVILALLNGAEGVGAAVGVLGVIAALLVYATVRLHRARGWIRFAGFDHRSYRIAARDRDYARQLAELNGGRIR
jgi:hypothetical protein